MIFDCIILGAGASGLMCASKIKTAKTLIVEGNPQPGLKLLASGGGLCNFYNSEISFKNYYGQNPHFCISALKSFDFEDFKKMLAKNKAEFTLREDGKFFARSSKSVLDALLNSLPQNIDLRLGCKFDKASKNRDIFEVFAGGKVFKCKNLVCSLGALSRKSMGASPSAFDLAESFGHEIAKPYPALCGVIFTGDLKKRFADTAGISLQAELSCGKNKFEGGLLFTHEGLSGPALFNLSLYGIKNKTLEINFCPKIKAEDFIKQNKNGPKHLLALLERLVPPRLAKALLNGFDKRTADLTKSEIALTAREINAFSFTVDKLGGYEKAEITAGGVSTKDISSRTMMSQKVKSLYFTGECLDVSGQLGGYNLAWAWASACAAAKAINET